MPNWLLQNLVSSIVYGGIILATGAVVTWLKVKRPVYAPYAIYCLAAMTCAAILAYTFTGLVSIKHYDQVTTDNVEEYARKWADSLGMSVSRTQSPAVDAYFAIVVTLKNGNPIAVARLKEIPDYLQFQIQLTLSEEHQAAFSKLTKEQAQMITQEVMLELARARISNTVMYSAPQAPVQTQAVVVMKSVPIDGLTKDGFVNCVNEIDSGVMIVRSATILALGKMQQATLHLK